MYGNVGLSGKGQPYKNLYSKALDVTATLITSDDKYAIQTPSEKNQRRRRLVSATRKNYSFYQVLD